MSNSDINFTPQNNWSRRDFIKTSLAGLAAGATFISSCQTSGYGGIPYRTMGPSGIKVPILGLGGWTIGKRSVEEAEALYVMHKAIDEGLRFFDNCWDYNAGVSEERMGKALASPEKRDKVFVMTKPCGRLAVDAKQQLEESLKRLKTDYIDLWMFHGIRRMEDRDLIFGKDGAMEVALQAKKEGKVRYIGFTGHQDPDYHLNMLKEDFEWDACLMPTNPFDYHYRSFQNEVLPELTKKNVGVLGMKALLAGKLTNWTDMDVKLFRRYALSLPISSLMCGIENREQLDQDLSVARDFTPLTQKETDSLIAIAEQVDAKPLQLEHYKRGKTGCDWHYRKYEGFEKG